MDVRMQFITHTENQNDAEYLVIDKILYDSNAKKYDKKNLCDFLFDFEFIFVYSRMYMQFDNLFNDPAISENMNSFFNDNQDILYQELKQSMNGIFGNIIKKRMQNVFQKFPYRDFFSD